MRNNIFENPNYLDVTYSGEKASSNVYPDLLCKYILDNYYQRTGSLLDLGCGKGDHVRAFSRLGFKVAGLDVSLKVSEYLIGYSSKTADLENDPLPYPPASFDFVFSKSVIEHMQNPSALIAKAFEALRPGGGVVIMTPSWEYTHWGPFYIDHTHVTPFTATALKDALEISGFDNVEVTYFYQLPFLWQYPFLKLVAKLIASLPLPYRPYKKAHWPDGLNKLIRFSKEVMLLAVARKSVGSGKE